MRLASPMSVASLVVLAAAVALMIVALLRRLVAIPSRSGIAASAR